MGSGILAACPRFVRGIWPWDAACSGAGRQRLASRGGYQCLFFFEHCSSGLVSGLPPGTLFVWPRGVEHRRRGPARRGRPSRVASRPCCCTGQPVPARLRDGRQAHDQLLYAVITSVTR